MAGEEDLTKLFKSMSPSLESETYVFGHIPAKAAPSLPEAVALLNGRRVQMLFWENEGWSVVLPQEQAEGTVLQTTFPCRKITLNVHSSLDAVGFMAAITTKLTALRVGINPISGYFHDHLFVPVGKEVAVLNALEQMIEEVKS